MTEGLAAEDGHVSRHPEARVIGAVEDIDGDKLTVGVLGGLVLIGCADDILGLSYALNAEATELLAQLLVRASRAAGHG